MSFAEPTSTNPSVPGLFFVHNAVPAKNAAEILAWLERECASAPPGPLKRVVLQYGPQYDYGSRGVPGGANGAVVPFPEQIEYLCARIPDGGENFTQCIVNRYLPGEGISAHTDSRAFGPVIHAFTFGSSAEIVFAPLSGDKTRAVSVYTRHGSMYTMSGDARYAWSHAMPGRLSDRVDGVVRKRGTRYSVTFRTVL
jgi:alkylated DNA repair dioxygenase AlkB